MAIKIESVPNVTDTLPRNAFELDVRAVDASNYPRVREEKRNGVTWSVTADGRVVPFRYFKKKTEPPRPTAFFFHGMGIQIHSFRGIAPYVYATHDLIFVDYTSFSQPGGWPSGGVSLRLLTLGALKIPDVLGLNEISLVGSSLGGGLCLIAAIERPALVEKLVLINAAAFPQDLPLMYRLFRTPIVGEMLSAITPAEKLVGGVAYVGYTTIDKMPPDLTQAYTHTMATRENRGRLRDLMRHLPASAREMNAYAQRAKEIRQPVLVIWGEQERLLAPDNGKRMATELHNARYVGFHDLAHLPHEEAPERVGEVVAEFLGK